MVVVVYQQDLAQNLQGLASLIFIAIAYWSFFEIDFNYTNLNQRRIWLSGAREKLYTHTFWILLFDYFCDLIYFKKNWFSFFSFFVNLYFFNFLKIICQLRFNPFTLDPFFLFRVDSRVDFKKKLFENKYEKQRIFK